MGRIVTAIVAAAIVLSLSATTCMDRRNESEIAMVTFAAGDVRINGRAAATDDELKAADVVTTGRASTADVAAYGRLVRARPQAEFELAVDGGATVLRLTSGALLVKVDKPPKESATKVVTPAAVVTVASARGAQFAVSHIGGKTLVIVRDGAVAVGPIAAPDKTVNVGEGRKIEVAAGKGVTRGMVVAARDPLKAGYISEPPMLSVGERMASKAAKAKEAGRLYVSREWMYYVENGKVAWDAGTIAAPVKDGAGDLYIASKDRAFKIRKSGELVWMSGVAVGVRGFRIDGGAFVVNGLRGVERFDAATGAKK